jgi:hypothetical protein
MASIVNPSKSEDTEMATAGVPAPTAGTVDLGDSIKPDAKQDDKEGKSPGEDDKAAALKQSKLSSYLL